MEDILKEVRPINGILLCLGIAAAALVVSVLSESLTKNDEEKTDV